MKRVVGIIAALMLVGCGPMPKRISESDIIVTREKSITSGEFIYGVGETYHFTTKQGLDCVTIQHSGTGFSCNWEKFNKRKGADHEQAQTVTGD